MATEARSRRRKRKKIIRRSDGALYDASERRRITAGELRDYLRDGGLFEARRHESGTDCTYEVLQEVIGAGMLSNFVPGLGGGGLPGLGALGSLAGGGGALGGIVEVLRTLGDGGAAARSGGRDWDDWEEPPRRLRESDERGWGDADAPRGSGVSPNASGGSEVSPKARAKRKPRPDGFDWADEPDSN